MGYLTSGDFEASFGEDKTVGYSFYGYYFCVTANSDLIIFLCLLVVAGRARPVVLDASSSACD
jgi:hypothetical protein